MNFEQKGNILEIKKSNLNEEEIEEVLSYLGTHPEITEFDSSYTDNNQLLIAIAGSDKSKNLTTFDFQNAQQVSDYEIKSLLNSSYIAKITNLNLGYTNLTDKGMHEILTSDIRHSNNITHLQVNGTELTDEAFSHLSNMSSLTDISLSKNNTLQVIIHNKKLTNLSVHENKNITDEGLKQLPNSLTNLNIVYCRNITDEGLKQLPNSLISLNVEGCDVTDEGLKNLPNSLTSLNVAYCRNITNEGFKNLLSSLTSLDVTGCHNITDEGLKQLPEGLTSLDISWCRNITDEGLKQLPKGLTSLNVTGCRNITDEGLKQLPNSLISLNLIDCNNITNKGLEKLPKNLTSLNIEECRNIITGIEKLVETRPEIVISTNYSAFYNFLVNTRVANKPSFELKNEIKDAVFNSTHRDREGIIVKHILENQEKYPFLVNSKDKNGHDLMHYYNHAPEMQKFLFEKGMVPTKDPQGKVMHNIVASNESVYESEVIERTNFFTKELVQKFGDDHAKLTTEAEKYKNGIKQLFTNNSRLTIDLLDLTSQEKKSVMEKTLRSNAKLPSDDKFIEAVVEKAFKVLEEEYLKKDASGKYDEGYPTCPLQYDWTKGAEKKITIPEFIGLISKLASESKPSLDQMKELTVTLYTKKQGKSGKEAYGYIRSLDDENKIKEIFQKESGLNIEEVYKEQQKFKLAKQLYVAATNSGDESSACLSGVWVQTIATASEIDSGLNDKWGEHQEAERAKEVAQNNITAKNIIPFLEKCTEEILLKRGSEILSNSDLKYTLLDFAFAITNVEKPENITKLEQQIFSAINTYFVEHIKEFLPNYSKDIPTGEQYITLIKQFSEIPAIQKFAINYSDTISLTGEDTLNVSENV